MDFVLQTPNSPLTISRSYATEVKDGPLGPGWRLDFASRLEMLGKDEALLLTPTGNQVFRRRGGNEYFGPDGQRISRSDQFSVLSTSAGAFIRFDAQGREVLRQDTNGNKVHFSYDPQGRPARISAGPHSEVRFTYRPDGKQESLVDQAGQQVVYSYDQQGRLSRVKDADGWSTTYRYDDKHRLSSIEYPDGVSETFAYDHMGRVAERRDVSGVLERYAYRGGVTRVSRVDGDGWEQGHDVEGRPLWRQDRAGRRETWTWGVDGQLLGRRYGDGSLLNLAYDDQGRLNSQESSTGNHLRFTYDDNGRLQSLDRNGAVTRYQYDERGNVMVVTSPAGRTTRFEHDARGRPTSVTDGAGRKTRLEFNEQGKLVRQEEPDGATTRWEFDDRGRVLRQMDPLGGVTAYQYQANGLLAKVEAPGVPETRFEYDAHGRLVAESYAGGRSEYGYDQAGRLVRVRHGDGTEERFAYAPDGQLAEQTDRLGNATRWKYGVDGRLQQMELPSGLVARYERTKPGNLGVSLGATRIEIQREAGSPVIRTRDEAGGTQLLELDPEGLLLRQVSPMGREELLQYDPDGLLTGLVSPGGDRWQFVYERAGLLGEIRYPNGLSRRFEYDRNGRLAALSLPWGGKVQYRYDPLGRLTERINARGQSVRYTFDAAGRLVQKQAPDGTWRYSYATNGDLRESSDGSLTQRYRHDANGRLIGIEYVEWGQKIQWRRDALGRVVERTGPGTTVVRYGYDRLGRPVLQEAGRALRLELAYDPLGRLASTRASTGASTSFAYDDDDRLTGVEHVTRDGTRLARRHGYDGDGNLTSQSGETGSQRMRYDADDQLLATSGAGPAVSYRYGPAGQRLGASLAWVEQAYRYDAGGRLVQAGEVRYAYDADGNRVMRTDARGTTRYAYDAEGRLTAVTLPDGRRISYGYGSWGERLWRETAGSRSHFVHDGDDLVAELDAVFRPRASYFFTASDRPWALIRPDGARLYHLDAQNTVLALSDADGRVRTRYLQDAFGDRLNTQGDADAQALGYAGRPHDPDTRLVDMRARFYDPEVGVFLAPDPLLGVPADPASLLLYAYARNNPYRYADTSGLAGRAYDPFPEALRGSPPPLPPRPWPGHTQTHDANVYYHDIAQRVYENVRDRARQGERAAEQQAMQQRMANPEPGYDNRTVQQTPERQAMNYVGRQAGAAWSRAGGAVRTGVQRVEAAAQHYAGGAARLSSVTGRSLMAIRMADIAGEALAADDPTQVLSDRSLELAGQMAAFGLMRPAALWLAHLAPAAVTVGGAAVATVALTAASAERVHAAVDQGGQWLQARMGRITAENRAEQTSRAIVENRELNLNTLRGKAAELQRLRGQLASQAAEAQALELDAANQRNAAQAKAGQAQALRGKIQSHEAVLAGVRGRLAGLDTSKLGAMKSAIEALVQQVCAEGAGIDRAGLADQADSQANALEATANPADSAQALAQMEAESGVADGFVSEAEEFQAALQGYRRVIQERYGTVQGLAAGYAAALQQARNMQVAVKGSANSLRLFLQGDDLATISAIAQEAATGLPAEGALTDAVQSAQESLGSVDVEAMLGGIANEAQSHAGVAALYLATVQADYGAAQGIAAQGREAASRARECAGRLGIQPESAQPGEPDKTARECDTNQDCALGYQCNPAGACIRDPRFDQSDQSGTDAQTGAQDNRPACATPSDCREGQQCRQGQCISGPSGAGVDAVLNLFGQRQQQRDQEQGTRGGAATGQPGGGRFTSEGLRNEINLLQQSASGTSGESARQESSSGSVNRATSVKQVDPSTEKSGDPYKHDGTSVSPSDGSKTTKVKPPPATPAQQTRQWYVLEAMAGFNVCDLGSTCTAAHKVPCTLTYWAAYGLIQSELQEALQRIGKDLMGLVRGYENARLVSTRVYQGPSATLLKTPVSGSPSKLECRKP